MNEYDVGLQHGPSSSAERMERRKTFLQKSIEKSFWQERQRKLDKQNMPEILSNIFKDVSVYFSGYTDTMSFFHLRKIVLSHGGRVNYAFSVKKTTHIVCTTLSGSKIEHWRSLSSRQSKIHIVHPKWLLDCHQQRKLLPVTSYRVLPKDKDTDTITTFLNSPELPDGETHCKCDENAEEVVQSTCDKDIKKKHDIPKQFNQHPLQLSLATPSQRKRHLKLQDVTDAMKENIHTIRTTAIPAHSSSSGMACRSEKIPHLSVDNVRNLLNSTVAVPTTVSNLATTTQLSDLASVPLASKATCNRPTRSTLREKRRQNPQHPASSPNQ